MSIFTDLLNVWRKENLLSQAWDESLQMLDLSHKMFNKAVKKSKKQENLSVLKEQKNRDKEINSYQREVRRKIVTHFALEQSTHDVTSLMVLVNMIVDIERIGDYSKNILDLAMNYPDALNTKHLHKDLYNIEKAVKERFDNTVDAVKTQDIEIARDLLNGYKDLYGDVSYLVHPGNSSPGLEYFLNNHRFVQYLQSYLPGPFDLLNHGCFV